MSVNHAAEFVKRIPQTDDAFLGGRLSIAQPRDGFRAGTESVLLAAAVSPASATLLDLGAGAGVAGLCALANNPGLRATLVDNDPHAVAFARHNAQANALADRTEVIELDLTARGADRQAAGLYTDRYDTVISNPPFFETRSGTLAPTPRRAAARHMNQQAIAAWIKTAASCSNADAEIIFIHSAQALPALLAGFAERFGGISVLPIVSRPGEPATRVLVRGLKASRSPLQLLAPFVMHGVEGNKFSPEADAIFRGRSTLDWRRAS